MAGLFDSVDSFLQQATPAGWLGFYDDNTVDYNDIFAQQTALYKEEMNRRNKKFEANEVINANLATNTLLVGGSKPVGGSGAQGTNFQLLQDEFAKLVANTGIDEARADSNLAGLQGDALAAQQQANAKRRTMVS